MKIRLLPEIDLARIATLPPGLQKDALRQVKFFVPKITYNSFRSVLPEIFNEQPPLFEISEHRDRPPWNSVTTLLEKRARNAENYLVNFRVAKSLYDFCEREEIEARHQDIFPTALSIGIKVEYWLRTVLIQNSEIIVPFIDPRRGKNLTRLGRKFALSMMHERVRVLEPDLYDARLAIFQFQNDKAKKRPLKITYDHDVSLYTFDELDEMVRTTYEYWFEVLEEREQEAREAGGRGTLI